MAQPITTKQQNFIERLLAERKVSDEFAEIARATDTKFRASRIVGQLMDMPYAQDREVVEAGYYVDESDNVFRVKWNRAETRTYAMGLEINPNSGSAKWVYARGAIQGLQGREPMGPEKAAELGRLNGVCVICGKKLTDPESVARGIGPVCIKNL